MTRYETKIVFSCSNDCAVTAYGSGGGVNDKIAVSDEVIFKYVYSLSNNIIALNSFAVFPANILHGIKCETKWNIIRNE